MWVWVEHEFELIYTARGLVFRVDLSGFSGHASAVLELIANIAASALEDIRQHSEKRWLERVHSNLCDGLGSFAASRAESRIEWAVLNRYGIRPTTRPTITAI
ncbi:hypothetical protein [Microbacterium sp. 4NA327F11]|uniref:hypothetical protein n=1 Tax=Microbacterium sp. 4NA327F11 TaxID=2502229 RepID=UPI0010FA07EB|nr:hypothetical protein [Microbacterium sp. 4NA327F11]